MLTVAAIGGFAYVQTTAAIGWLVRKQMETISTAARSEVNHLLSSATNVLDELAATATEGRLPLDDQSFHML